MREAARLDAHEGGLAKVGNATVRPEYFALFETSAGAELLHASAPALVSKSAK